MSLFTKESNTYIYESGLFEDASPVTVSTRTAEISSYALQLLCLHQKNRLPGQMSLLTKNTAIYIQS